MDENLFQRPLLVTFDEAARLLSVSRRTVQRLVAAGRLEVVRLTADSPRLRYDDLATAFGGDQSQPA